MTTLILVPGTWGGDHDWTTEGSDFRQFVEARDFTCLNFQGWSGDASGIPNPTDNGKHSDWIAGGFALAYFLRTVPYFQRNIIAHSHGGQVVAYCCARTQTPVRRLLTISTPIRKDMDDIWKQAKPLIGYHEHVRSKGWDLMQRLGEAFDGSFGWKRDMPYANENLSLKGISHSNILKDEKYIPLLEKEDILENLRAPIAHII